MKVVLFCGGKGMRMREFSESIPKPMVPIGNRPVLWHLMRYYAHYGHTDFIICLGHMGNAIKEYFLNYQEWVSNDFILSDGGSQVELLGSDTDDWRMTFVDTGIDSNIGQRLLAVRGYLDEEPMFLANYADGLSDAPLPEMVDNLRSSGKVASFLCIKPSQSFHVVDFDDAGVVRALRAVEDTDIRINGGFFVLSQRIFDYMRPGEELVQAPFTRLIADDELVAFRHDGFWAGMDTFKDRQELDEMYSRGGAGWEVWKHGGPPEGT
ncbi:MAG: sugar phosphate nucleotidyltransferase [Microthrixaceae bacterium]